MVTDSSESRIATEGLALTGEARSNRVEELGAKVVEHGRYVTFQLAEVAVTRGQFRNILQLSDEFRLPPTPRTRLLSLIGPFGYNRSNLQGPLGEIGQNAYFRVQSKTHRGLARTGDTASGNFSLIGAASDQDKWRSTTRLS